MDSIQLLLRKSFDIFDKTLAFTSYWLGFMAKKPIGYPGREEILSRTNLLALKKFIGEIARFFPNHLAWMSSIELEHYIDFKLILEFMVYCHRILPRFRENHF